MCGCGDLKPVLNLGAMHLQGSFVKLGREMPPNRRIPCELVRCDPEKNESACGLLQLRHSTPPSILYSDYWYRSGTNETMVNHLYDLAREAVLTRGENPQRVLDIGCNDLTLLSGFAANERVGIDPSEVSLNSTEKAAELNCQLIHDVFPSEKLSGKFDIITSIAMFYDLENPIYFACSIQCHLNDTGIWVVEMSYMPHMLDNNSYDTICHEHLEYYSFAVLEHIFETAGLVCVRAELNDCNGGSIRCYVAHKRDRQHFLNKDWQLAMQKLRQSEFELQLDTDKPYAEFSKRIEDNRLDLVKALARMKQQGHIIHVLGASTKGNTILQWCGIDSRIIDKASDRNPDKERAMTLGTNIQIVSEEESRRGRPHYYLILPWHFQKSMIDRERAAGYVGGFIIPLPHLQIISPISSFPY